LIDYHLDSRIIEKLFNRSLCGATKQQGFQMPKLFSRFIPLQVCTGTKNKEESHFRASLDHQGASNTFIMALRAEGGDPLFVKS
jgi:hypothetical protein